MHRDSLLYQSSIRLGKLGGHEICRGGPKRKQSDLGIDAPHEDLKSDALVRDALVRESGAQAHWVYKMVVRRSVAPAVIVRGRLRETER